jgi:hypothetical protein
MVRNSGFIKNIFPVLSGSAGETKYIKFNDGSYLYMGLPVNQTFDHALLDNIGLGDVRVSFREGLELTSAVSGAKTLKAGDVLSVSERAYYIAIYFIADSIVEMIFIAE